MTSSALFILLVLSVLGIVGVLGAVLWFGLEQIRREDWERDWDDEF